MRRLIDRCTGGRWTPSAAQFALFRGILGIYLSIHFVHLIPYGPELFGRNGTVPDPTLQPTWGLLPNLLAVFDSDLQVQAFLSILAGCAMAFTVMSGTPRRVLALVLWYGWACLFNRNIFIGNPGLPMVGWLLLACAVIPVGELGFGKRSKTRFVFPPIVYWGAWFILALGYTVSGIHKMGSPSWADGSAISHLLENPLARDTYLRTVLFGAPAWVTSAMTYLSLALEIFFLPLALFPKTRGWIWLLMIGMHANILCIVDFADLTTGVLMMHLFVFDTRWIPARRLVLGSQRLVFFDGMCGLCNGFVEFLMRHDLQRRFRYATLQSDRGRALPGVEFQQEDPSTVVLVDGNEQLVRSAAVLRVFSHLGGGWRLMEVFRVIPAPIRDGVYRWIASHRYAWFGKRETCRIPTPEERELFLS